MNWYLLALGSAAFSALAAILEKKSLFRLNALGFSFTLACFNLLFSIPFFITVNWEQIDYTALLILYGKSIMGTFSFLFIMEGLKRMEISRSLPLLTLTPALVALFAFLFLNETLSLWQTMGMFALLTGTYIIQTGNNKSIWEPFTILFQSKGLRYILAALLIFTATSMIDKLLVGQYKLPPYDFIAFQHLFLAFNFSVLMLIKKQKPEKGLFQKKNLILIIAVAACTIVYRYTQIEAVKIASVALVLSLKRTSVFFATLIGGKLFNEKYLLRKSIATLVMIAGAALVILK